ncbi:MAG: hypothetical protein KGL39_37685 [Patescibacteria group bacterium]|nr:hypothetical protein [Patescibacteria group bacterium]
MSDLPQLGHNGKFNLSAKDLKPSLTEALNLALKGQHYRDKEGRRWKTKEKGVLLRKIAERIIGMCIEGNEKMAALVWDRTDGKVIQGLQLGNDPIQHEHIHKFLVSREDIEETAAILAKLGIGRAATQSLMDKSIVIDATIVGEDDAKAEDEEQVESGVHLSFDGAEDSREIPLESDGVRDCEDG